MYCPAAIVVFDALIARGDKRVLGSVGRSAHALRALAAVSAASETSVVASRLGAFERCMAESSAGE
jgi:hypothetical protein